MAIPIMAIAALASTAYSVYKSAQQNKEAKEIDTTRPNYEIPSEVRQNIDMYQSLANSDRMPAQGIAEDNINRGVANSVYNIDQTGGSVNNRLSAIAQVNNNQNDAYNNLAAQAASYKMQNINNLSNARNIMAEYRDQKFDYNQHQPYMYNVTKRDMLQNASNQNMQNSLNSASEIAGQYAAYKYNKPTQYNPVYASTANNVPSVNNNSSFSYNQNGVNPYNRTA